MAKIKAFGHHNYNMNEIDFSNLLFGANYVERGNLFRVEYSDGLVDQFKGSGFRYDSDGVPVSGTVKSYTLFDGNTKLVTIDALNIAATKLVKVAQTMSSADDIALIRTALKGNDQITGGRGDDTILGFNGNDVLKGGEGHDSIYGGNGNDQLIGGYGSDYLVGGKGADRFVFQRITDSDHNETDTIQDFSQKQKDRIDLKAIDAQSMTPGNDKFTFIGNAEFTGTAGELRYVNNGNHTVIEADVDGNGERDFFIQVRGGIDFIAADFIL